MVNEHYVPQAYLRLFAPSGEGLIARYSLVEKHDGGDYVPPKNRYSVRKAAASEGFADGLLEDDETPKAEGAMRMALRSIVDGENLSEVDIANISQFIALQRSRSVESKLYFEAREQLSRRTGDDIEERWESALAHDSNHGYKTLQHMGWRIVENESSTPFITSDAPVVRYFNTDRNDVDSSEFQIEGREIYCPLSPDRLLLILDPSRFRVEGQHPQTEIERVIVSDSREVSKFNLLQGINAFQEVFGPVGTGSLLERTIDALVEAFPDEDYIRGNRGDIETIQKAQELAAGGIETESERRWYAETGRQLIRSRRKKTQAIWDFEHGINIVDNLRRNTPDPCYWDDTPS